MVKKPPVNAGDVREMGSIPGSETSRGGGHGNPLQYSCLENPMDRGAWRATVHRVEKNQTRWKQLGMHAEKEVAPAMEATAQVLTTASLLEGDSAPQAATPQRSTGSIRCKRGPQDG